MFRHYYCSAIGLGINSTGALVIYRHHVALNSIGPRSYRRSRVITWDRSIPRVSALRSFGVNPPLA